jgi:hypothetical protein
MINTDQLRERIRERLMETTDSYNRGHCANCHADLTVVDKEAGECSNCHSTIDGDDEDLQDDGDGDY